MGVVDYVRASIREERESGLTLKQISRRHDIPVSYVGNLLNGKRGWDGITLGTFDRMFPRASVDLLGRPQVVADHGSQAAGRDLVQGDRSEALRARIILDLLDLAIDANTLTLVLKTVKGAQVK